MLPCKRRAFLRAQVSQSRCCFHRGYLCTGPNQSVIKEMLENCEDTAMVYIIGDEAKSEDIEAFSQGFPSLLYSWIAFPPILQRS